MINLSFAEGEIVFVQLKQAVFLLGYSGRSFVPMAMRGSDQYANTPIALDHVEGKLRLQNGQPILTYANPTDPRTSIDVALDPDNIVACWIAGKIELVSATGSAPAVVAPAQ
jgi:hypothetical protein